MCFSTTLQKLIAHIHCVSKNDTDVTDVAHYKFDADQQILIIFADMLLRQRVIKWRFVILPLLINVSALPAET